MASLPTIHTIMASDAPQHTDRLREVLQELETENRINGFTTLGTDDDLSSISDTLKKDDMILILLTNELDEKREQIKKSVKTLRSNQPELRIAEILADNLIYDNEFITFPDDLRPIRNREDMDEVWSNIARSLRDIFPVKNKKAKPFPAWVLFAVLGVLLFGGLLFIILPTASVEETEETFTTVPDLAGMSGTEAVSLLLDAGLEAGQRRAETHDTVNKDLVIRSEPNAGETIEQGAQVTLILSSGREQVRVPELTGVTLARARAEIERAGLRVGQQRSEHSDEIERARVIRTDPSAGHELDPGTQINLVTSLGQEEVVTSLQGEDCLSFNHQNLEVRDDGGRFLVTDGRSRMMTFRTRNMANQAVRIMQHYQMDNHCFAIRPNPALRYFKTGGDIPSGSFSGEDCNRISNPQNLTIRETSSDLFQVLDGNSIPYAARSREEAERVIEIVQHYNAGFTCYVERPDPGMIYLRR